MTAQRGTRLGRAFLWVQVADLLTLVALIAILGSIEIELNPIIRWIYGAGGLVGLVAVKLAAGLVGQAGVDLALRLGNWRAATGSLAGIVLFAASAAAMNVIALAQVVAA
jgi:hypothetical protein